MNRFFARLVLLVVFGALCFALLQMPSVTAFDVKIHGFGWVIIVVGLIAESIFWTSCLDLKGFLSEKIVRNPVVRVVLSTVMYLSFAGFYVAVGLLYPGYVALSSPGGLLWVFGCLGFFLALVEVVEERLSMKK